MPRITAGVKIRAAVWRAAGAPPTIEELALTGPGPDEVLVRIVATGICHTDLKAAATQSAVPRPVVLGHEGAGVVEAVGARVSGLAKGDHVVMTFDSCGRCPSCLAAEPAYCHTQDSFRCTRDDGSFYLHAGGEPIHGDFFKQSSFATYAIGTERNTIKVARDVPLDILGPLGCGVQTGAGAILHELRLRPGESLAVTGAGTVGLAAVMAARVAGAGRIVAVDRDAGRLELARELGADHVILATDSGLAEAIMDDLGIGADCVLDTTGALDVMRQALDVLAPRGRCGYVTGPWDGSELSVSILHLMHGRRIHGIIQGNSNPSAFIPMLIGLYRQGRFPFDRLIRFYPFDDIAAALADSESGATVKPVLKIGDVA